MASRRLLQEPPKYNVRSLFSFCWLSLFSASACGSVLVVPFCTLGRFYFEKTKTQRDRHCLIWSHRAGHAGFSTGCALGHKSWGNSLIPHKPPLQILSLALYFLTSSCEYHIDPKNGQCLSLQVLPLWSMEGPATEQVLHLKAKTGTKWTSWTGVAWCVCSLLSVGLVCLSAVLLVSD